MTDMVAKLEARRAEIRAQKVADLERRRAEIADPRKARIEAARAGTLEVSPENARRASAADQVAGDEMTLASNPGAFNVAASAVQGVPFVGSWVDDMASPEQGERIRQTQGAMERQRPGTDTALKLGTGVLASIPLAIGAAAAGPAVAPASLAGRVALGAGAGAVAGGTEGAIYGAGTDAGDRSTAATEGAVGGTAIGAGFGVLAPLGAAGVRSVLERLRKSDVRTIQNLFDIKPKAAAIIRNSLRNDDLDGAVSVLESIGDDAMLADSGPAARHLLDSAMSEGGKPLTVGRNAVEARSAAAAPALKRTLDSVLGVPEEGVKSGQRKIAQQTARVREAAYGQAYDAPIDYSSKAGYAIESVLDRIPDKIKREAVEKANALMQLQGKGNNQILLDLDTGKFREMPNVMQLDYIKRALGDIAESDVNAKTGAKGIFGQEFDRIAVELRNAIGDSVPSYLRAVKLGGDKIADQAALRLGSRALTNAVKVEDVAEGMRHASKSEKEAFRRGLRTAIEEQMDAVRAVRSDPNIDARQAAQAVLPLTSDAFEKKVTAALGPAAAKRLKAVVAREMPKLETRAAVARGSQTAYRQGGKRAVDAVMEPGAVGTLARGEAVGAGKRTIQALMNTAPDAVAGEREQVLAEVVDVLTKVRGAEAGKALRLVRDAMNGQTITEEQAASVARLVASTGALGGHQSMTQSLGTR